MSIVREDSNGIFVRHDGRDWRPGPVPGYSHACDMSDGGLKKGDKVRAHHSPGPTVRITKDDGSVLIWHLAMSLSE